MTFTDELKKTASKKILLARVTSAKPTKFFSNPSTNTYTKTVKHFVSGVTINGSAATFTYDVTTKLLTVTSTVNPNTNYTVVTYKHFFSNFSVDLPYDLASGAVVPWDSRVDDIGELKLELDYENSGIAIESNSNLSLQNTDGYFDDIFDTHIFENKPVEFYYYFEGLSASEAKLIYKGIILDKSFNSKQVKFNLKDSFYSLRDTLSINLFGDTDGSYDDSLYLKPKRRIYGEVSKLKCVSLSQLKGEFTGQGTLSGTVAAASPQNITGTGTAFLSQLNRGEKIIVHTSGGDVELSVADIASDSSFQSSELLTFDFVNATYTVSDVKTYSKYFNRTWSIAGHALASMSATITAKVDLATYQVNDNQYFEKGDLIELNSARYTVINVYSNIIILNQNVSPAPSVGDIIYKIPVKAAYLRTKQLVYKRDYEYTNASTGANLVLYATAEFNVATTQLSKSNVTFTAGSRVVTTTYDMRSVLSERDFIKPDGVTNSTWYEILYVDETQLVLRTASATSYTGIANFKNIDYAEDDSVVAVDCIGIQDGTKWIRYAGEVVEHILKTDVGVTTTSSYFTSATDDAKFKLSAFYPRNMGDDSPVIRDVISEINGSVLGSLYYDTNFNFKYSILNANKDPNTLLLGEDDVISYDVVTKNNIINSGKIEYKPETDLTTGELVYNAYTYTSDFVNYAVGISLDKTFTTVLFDASVAQTILRRHIFFNSLTNSVVKVQGKLNLSSLDLNSPVEVALDRIYKRYAGKDKRKVGLVNYISKKATSVDIYINDLGGIFSRVPSVAPSTLTDIATSSSSDIAKYGFIVDTTNETPNGDEDYYGTNLIG